MRTKLLAALVLLLLAALPAQAQSQGQTRRDTFVGTANEGIVMERDPVSGDNVISVTPPPQPEQPEDNQTKWPVYFQPQINYKP